MQGAGKYDRRPVLLDALGPHSASILVPSFSVGDGQIEYVTYETGLLGRVRASFGSNITVLV